ncbi:MAG: right-handed parallel beta-helix repeat-containing protein [Bacteroidales bacterium]|nr:right-handed parallel beta-helix repeat-containing protein [Bacteroidales bacterium]
MGINVSDIKAGSTYILKHHVNLKGKTIVFPENTTIIAEGGSFSNGTIVGAHTWVKGDNHLIFKNNIKLRGTFEADTAFSEWFDIKSNCRVVGDGRLLGGTDNYQAFKNLFLFKNISISKGSYMLSGQLECQSNQTINGNGATLKFYHRGGGLLVDGNPIRNVSITDLHIIGSKYDYDDKTEYWHGVNINYAENIVLDNIVVEACRGDGVYIGGTQSNGGDNRVPKDIYLSNVRSLRNHRQGLSITRCENVFAEGCEFSETSGTLPNCGVDIEPNSNLAQGWFNKCLNVRFKSCKFWNNENFGLLISGREMSSDKTERQIAEVYVEDCSFENDGICVYGVNGLEINDCVLHDCGIRMTAYGRIKDVSVEDVDVSFDIDNESCGFQLVLLEQECSKVSLKNFKATSCGIFGVYVTRGTKKDSKGNPYPLLNGFLLSDIFVANCSNSIFVSENVRNAVYDGVVIKDNGIDRKGLKMKSRYGNNLEFVQLDDRSTRRIISSPNTSISR